MFGAETIHAAVAEGAPLSGTVRSVAARRERNVS